MDKFTILFLEIGKVDSRKIIFRFQVSPYKIELIPIPQDEHGLIPDILRETLRNRKLSGKKMPKIMYINATGMNPTGAVIPLERRKEIYRIACEYNFLILDDDPYHFLHFEEVNQHFLFFLYLIFYFFISYFYLFNLFTRLFPISLLKIFFVSFFNNNSTMIRRNVKIIIR